MMQANEVRQRFTQIERTIHQASEACQRAASVSSDLKSSIQQLDERSEQAHQELAKLQDEDSIRQCVDELEQLGDRAKDACERAGNVDQNVKNAVLQAHQELSELKHQLH
jgi:chromosome segregation ATPase